MSSRLGVTLGYDEKSEDSNIYVVEVYNAVCFDKIGVIMWCPLLDPARWNSCSGRKVTSWRHHY